MFMPIFIKLRHLETEIFVMSKKFPNIDVTGQTKDI